MIAVMDSGIGKKVTDLLCREEIQVDTFDQVLSDPDIACAEASIGMAKRGKYELIVGVGGGSSMDIASATSVMLTNPGTLNDYLGINLVKNPGIATFLIPIDRDHLGVKMQINILRFAESA